MPKKEESGFTVTDRRRFTDEGEARAEQESSREEARPEQKAAAPPPSQAAPEPKQPEHKQPEHKGPPPPPPLSDQQREESSRAYRESTNALDEQLRKEVGAQAVSDEFKVGIDRVVEPLYLTAMMQLGLMGQEGPQRRVDIIGARQTIDTIIFLQEKTKGNLTKEEADLLENIIYQLRMSYLEITNALARAVQNPPGAPVPPTKA